MKSRQNFLIEENTLSLMLSNPQHVTTVCDQVAELAQRIRNAGVITDSVPASGDGEPACCFCQEASPDAIEPAYNMDYLDGLASFTAEPGDWACRDLDHCMARHQDYWKLAAPAPDLPEVRAELSARRSALQRWLDHSHFFDSVLEPRRAPRPLPAYDDTIWALSAPSGPSGRVPGPVLAGSTISQRAVAAGTWQPPEEPKPKRQVRHRPRKPYR